MKILAYFIILINFVLYSCHFGKDNKNISLTGKWHRFSMNNGYTEFDIDSQYVVFYNHKVGRFKLAYKIENDSFKYLTHKYAAKITYYGDSIFLSGNDNTTATLYRFIAPDIPFDSIPDEKDSVAFETYIKGFDKRLIHELEKAGIEFFNYEEQLEDTVPLYQKLLDSKKDKL